MELNDCMLVWICMAIFEKKRAIFRQKSSAIRYFAKEKSYFSIKFYVFDIVYRNGGYFQKNIICAEKWLFSNKSNMLLRNA